MLIAALLLAAAPAATEAPYRAGPVSPADQAQIRRQADKVLRDGPSTRWQWGPRLNAGIYCGQFNAKNSFGAYVGWRPFLYVDSKLFLIDETESDRIMYEGFCGSAGYIPKAAPRP